ncbi:MAG: bifunctional glutamate N-acetyltransferase/amino-acid acetyltransferase ArgJ [Anaerolineae bacterium]|nr:bifunctional glutamate N-acetyltransferase/amino-acid acetyltransferase ArgJ [Anaerolineae bacterium]
MTTQTALPKGFRAAGIAAGIKKNGKPDLTLITSDTDCKAAAVFTTNKVKAAPVLRGMAQLNSAYAKEMRAVVINAGCANACTGEQGLRNADATAQLASTLLRLNAHDQVMVMSTGVIGVQLPMDKFQAGMPQAVAALNNTSLADIAQAIMTTDTVPKSICRTYTTADGKQFTIAGIAKGAGMIHPNMATMLSVVMTDAKVSLGTLRQAVKNATNRSFNCITIDGDTSTNDTFAVLANGASGAKPSATEFEDALNEVSMELAKKIARDGEGATKFITIRVTGARTWDMAHKVGRTIATSPLVKTAFYGEDANWGRITCAAGYSGEDVNPDHMSLWFGGVHVFSHGTPTHYSDADATAAMKPVDVEVHLDLGLGEAECTVWTCDMSHDYVTINGKYRT